MGIRKLLSGTSTVFTAILLAASVGAVPAQAAGSKPKAPVITEPGADSQLVSGADVHMETSPMSDADGDKHLCSDWEIWTESPKERVWFADCIGGVQKVHTHLGDGVFQNAFAGRRDLLPDRDYELRVRHRDDSGDASTEWSPFSVRPFRTDVERAPLPGAPDWRVVQPGYVVEEVASGFKLAVNIAMVPNHTSDLTKPLFYVTELYGKIKVVRGDFKVSTYADDLLDFNPNGQFPGSGELGVTGIVVDPVSGDLFASMLYENGGLHYPKVVRFKSKDGGFTADSKDTILDMYGEAQGASHQISNLSIGPDGKLYVHLGDGFFPETARDLGSFRGKILRMNLDGSAPSDNPFYKKSDGINAKDYVYAYGFRNPFGGTWRASDGKHYEVENGPAANDRLARVDRGEDYGWAGSPDHMKKRALYNWSPPHAPVNITFVEGDKFHGSGFPAEKYDHAFVSESGPTYATGPQAKGKRIVEFTIDGDGASGPRTLVEYNGGGKFSVVGLTAGPDGLYFTSLYPSSGDSGPTGTGAKIFRVRYVPQKENSAPFVAYKDRIFDGASQSFGTGVFDDAVGELSGVGNNSITSFKVAAGYRAVLCDENSAGRVNTGSLGTCRLFGPGAHEYIGDDLNDRISMVSVLADGENGDAVTLYRNPDFGGTTQPVGPGGYEGSRGDLDKVNDNAISSLRVGSGNRVVACENDRESGINSGSLGLCRYYTTGDHATIDPDLDNKISLVAVGGPAVVAFRDKSLAGPSTTFGAGMYEAAKTQLGTVGNDAITSVRVADGFRLVACAGDSLGATNKGSLGLCRFFDAGVHNFVGADLDEMISLLSVQAGPSAGTALSTYQNRDFKGTKSQYGVGVFEAAKTELGPVGNDAASSLKLSSGYRAVACEHDSNNHTNVGSIARCRFYGPGNQAYLGDDMNDKISLIMIGR